MVIRLSLFIIIISQAQRAANSPLRERRSPRDIGTLPPQIIISTLQDSGTRLIPVFSQNAASHTVTVLPQHLILKDNGHNLVAPIPLSQFFFHSKLHIIPRPNIIQSAIQHVTNENVKIPVISHHSVSHTSQNANTTQSSSVLPVFIHGHIIPVHSHQHHHDNQHHLSVIPLQRHHKVEKLGHYRMEKNADEDEESSNKYRNYYGGHGTGLFFGGHGSGHGFYAYGK